MTGAPRGAGIGILPNDYCTLAQTCYLSLVTSTQDRSAASPLSEFLRPELFRCLADPVRLQVLARLAHAAGPATVTEVAECCGVHLSGVSRHLSQLRDAGVVEAQKQGREVRYHLCRPELVRYFRTLADLLEGTEPPARPCCEPTAPPFQVMPNTNRTHEEVSQAYEEALERSKQKSGGCCGGGPSPAGVAAKLVDYQKDVEGLPGEAVGSSFGCGNPLAFSGVRPGETVLDLGSGAGLDLLIAARIVGPEGRVIGIDMTDAMIEEARQNIERAGVANVEVRKGIIEALPVDDASVDWVISNCVINLAPDKGAVFAEIRRVLAPGGRFSISDIVVEELPDELRQLAVLRAACIGGAISETEYVDGLRAAGLEGVEVVERLVYESEQIAALAKLDEASESELPRALAEKYLPELTGKVWSAKFSGRRP